MTVRPAPPPPNAPRLGMPHPLEQTLRRIAALDDYLPTLLKTERDGHADWVSGAALRADGTPHLTDILARVAAHYGAADRCSPAALWFGHHAFIATALPIACYFVERRVPDLAAEDFWMRFDEEGEVMALAWEGRRFAALPDDPARDHPDCTVVDSMEALRARLREQVLGYFEALVPAVASRSAFGRPGLWALVSDYFASTFAWAAGLVGPEATGAAEVKRVAAPSRRLRRSREFIVVEHAGLSCHLIDRLSCCLYYTIKDGEYCTSCPHRSRESKVAIIRERLAKEAVEKAALVALTGEAASAGAASD